MDGCGERTGTDMKTAMHIHFWADIRNSSGSVEKVICSLASHGREFRHVIACCVSGHNLKTRHFDTTPYEYQGIPVYPFCEDRLRNRVLNKWFRLDAFTYSELIRRIREIKPDILHFHNRQGIVDAVVKRLDYRPGVVVHYHNNFRGPANPRSADVLMCCSQATARHIQERMDTGDRCQVLLNPLTLELLQAELPPRVDEQVPTILFGGGYQLHKGVLELIEAFNRLPRGSARLILAGQRFEMMAPLSVPGIEVAGLLSARDFFQLMAKCSIVAMPSHNEPFGLIAQEAMYMRKLLVVANRGGLTEFVDSDQAVMVDPDDVASIAAGLTRALGLLGSATGERMLALANSRVMEFHPDRIGSRLESIYQDILSATA